MRKQLLLNLLTALPLGGTLTYHHLKQKRNAIEFEKIYYDKPGTIHPEVKKAIKSHNIKVLKTPSQIRNWLKSQTLKGKDVENQEDWGSREDYEETRDTYYEDVYYELLNDLETTNASAILPGKPGAPAAIVVSPDIYNSAIMGHEVGHILDYHSRGITDTFDLMESEEDQAGIGDVLRQLVPGMSIAKDPLMKTETAAGDHAQVPEDDEVRTKALQTYNDYLKYPQYVTGGLAAGFLSRPGMKKLLKMKK